MKLRDLFYWQKRKKPECATERCFFWKELECDKHVKNPSIHGHDCPIHQDLFYHYPCSHCNKIDTCDSIFYGHGCLVNQRKRDHEIYGEKEICYTKNGVEITERDREYSKIYNHTFFHTNFSSNMLSNICLFFNTFYQFSSKNSLNCFFHNAKSYHGHPMHPFSSELLAPLHFSSPTGYHLIPKKSPRMPFSKHLSQYLSFWRFV